MEPLAALKDQIQVIAGLDHINATAGSDGAGDHARASASLLTGCRAKKTAGADIHLGPSIDQVAAQHVGHLTRFPSLELTCDTERRFGQLRQRLRVRVPIQCFLAVGDDADAGRGESAAACSSGCSAAGRPRSGARTSRLRQQTNRSILDFIREDARSLAGKLSTQDGHKLDEYLTSVREIEERIIKFEQVGEAAEPRYRSAGRHSRRVRRADAK